MSYTVKIQLCDDDSVITEIETEITDKEQGENCIANLSNALENFFTPELTCDDCKKLGETTCGNDLEMQCFEPKT